jgi:hypothetical protein
LTPAKILSGYPPARAAELLLEIYKSEPGIFPEGDWKTYFRVLNGKFNELEIASAKAGQWQMQPARWSIPESSREIPYDRAFRLGSADSLAALAERMKETSFWDLGMWDAALNAITSGRLEPDVSARLWHTVRTRHPWPPRMFQFAHQSIEAAFAYLRGETADRRLVSLGFDCLRDLPQQSGWPPETWEFLTAAVVDGKTPKAALSTLLETLSRRSPWPSPQRERLIQAFAQTESEPYRRLARFASRLPEPATLPPLTGQCRLRLRAVAGGKP